MRFSDSTSPSTLLKLLTDGLLCVEMISEPMLGKYQMLIIDEIHLRNTNTDLLLLSLATKVSPNLFVLAADR